MSLKTVLFKKKSFLNKKISSQFSSHTVIATHSHSKASNTDAFANA